MCGRVSDLTVYMLITDSGKEVRSGLGEDQGAEGAVHLKFTVT